MARTVRNPMETRTPVRTISSVMRNAPRQQFQPRPLDIGFDRQGGRRDDFGGQQRTPINQAVTSVVRPSVDNGGAFAPAVNRPIGGVRTPVAPTTKPSTSFVKPVAPKTTSTKTAATVKPASGAVKTSPVKPITSTAKAPTAPVKPITNTKTPTTPKTPVKPITTPTTKTPTSPVKPITTPTNKATTTIPKKNSDSTLTSILKNPITKTIAGAGAGALLGKVIGGNKTTTGGTSGTGLKPGTGTPGIKPGGTGPGLKTPGGGNPIGSNIGKTIPGGSKVTPKATPAAGAVAKTAKTDATKKAEIAAANPELTEEEIQAELDRAKAEETFGGPPDDAVIAEDGTYTVTDADGNISTYSATGELVGYEGPEATTLIGGDGSEDTTAMTDLGEGYLQDADGNIYSASGDLMYAVGEDGEYYDPNGDLIYDPNADTTTAEDGTVEDAEFADNTYTDPDTGAVYTLGDDGNWTTDYVDEGVDNTDYTVAENTDNTDYTIDDEEPPEEAKRGGSIHHKTKGGLPRFADGDSVDYSDTEEEVQPFQNVNYNYGEFDEPTMTGDNSLYSQSGPIRNTYTRAASLDTPDINSDFNATPGIQYFDDGSYIQTFDDGSTITVDSDGNVAGNTDGYQTTYDDYGNTIVTDGYGNMTVYDPDGNLVPTGGGRETVGPITSVGGNKRPSYATLKERVNPTQNTPDQSGIIDQLKGYITQNPGLAGGAIGALLASLMNQSGDSAGPSQPVDISALTAINPRTTDFGPGMTGGRTGTGSSIVNYNDYAEDYGDDTPDERLYSDLGISGYLNEPEMTDYTDEDGAPVDQYGNYLDANEMPDEGMSDAEQEPKMAAGGPTTHYTFGRVIDPAENLGMAQGMKKGGLSQAHTMHSHHTNPVVNNRVDFRKGSAVNGAGDGQSDDIPAWLADGEYVMDAELVSMLGNGSNKAGAKVLDKFREDIRAHKRSAPLGKIPPKAKSPLNYLKESMNG